MQADYVTKLPMDMHTSEYYRTEIIPKLMKEMNISNSHRVPKLVKIVVNIGLGEALKDRKILDSMSEQLTRITGQKPLVTKAHRAIATFKLRAGMEIGLKVTLRGARMWDFLRKVITIILPRVRDFRGINPKAFDHRGNLNLGFSEISVFPEVAYEKLDKVRGFEVTIVTTATNDEEGHMFLKSLGMPFVETKK